MIAHVLLGASRKQSSPQWTDCSQPSSSRQSPRCRTCRHPYPPRGGRSSWRSAPISSDPTTEDNRGSHKRIVGRDRDLQMESASIIGRLLRTEKGCIHHVRTLADLGLIHSSCHYRQRCEIEGILFKFLKLLGYLIHDCYSYSNLF